MNVKKTKSSKKIILKITMSMTALSSPKLATNKSCSWYLVNGHEEGERERSVGVCSVGKNFEIVEIALGDIGRHREA